MAVTIIIVPEALSIFGIRKKKTFPMYLQIVLTILISIFMLVGSFLGIYEYLEQIDGIDYEKIFLILIGLNAFGFYVNKTNNAIKAVKVIKEEQSVLVSLLTNPV